MPRWGWSHANGKAQVRISQGVGVRQPPLSLLAVYVHPRARLPPERAAGRRQHSCPSSPATRRGCRCVFSGGQTGGWAPTYSLTPSPSRSLPNPSPRPTATLAIPLTCLKSEVEVGLEEELVDPPARLPVWDLDPKSVPWVVSGLGLGLGC